MTERQARGLFRGAAIYGLAMLLPLYFLEPQVAAPAAALDRPEYYYGFVGAAAAWQLVYWTIGDDPLRYRAFMLLGVVAKLSFWIPCAVLWTGARTGAATFALSCGDLALAVAFLIAWRSLRPGD
ncbi:MAG: hypothetical protein JSR79_09815 [Proteobacteria bacterium]|nr:hypothetical protein [Pseudomonadota bacterium]